jgi:hypothetical protein
VIKLAEVVLKSLQVLRALLLVLHVLLLEALHLSPGE